MTKLLQKLIIITWPLGQLLTVSISPSIRLQPIDLLLTLSLLSTIFNHKQQSHIIKNQAFRPFLILVTYLFFSLLFNNKFQINNFNLASYLYFARFLIYGLFYFSLSLFPLKDFRMTLIIAIITFIGLNSFQYLFLPDMRVIRYLGFDDHYYRMIGPFLDPNFTGLIFTLITLYFIKSKKTFIFAIVAMVCLCLTFSRISLLTLLLSLLISSVSLKNTLKGLLLVVLALVIIILIPKPFGEGVNLLRTYSISSRLLNYQQSFAKFTSSPVIGLGFNTLKMNQGNLIANLSSGVDGSILFILVTSGFIGFTLFVSLGRKLLSLHLNSVNRPLLLAIFIHSFANNSLFFSWILLATIVVFYLPETRD